MDRKPFSPRLTIFRVLPREQAEMAIRIMLTMPETPTFAMERDRGTWVDMGTGKPVEMDRVFLWMSKRTYDYTMARLPEAIAAHREMVK